MGDKDWKPGLELKPLIRKHQGFWRVVHKMGTLPSLRLQAYFWCKAQNDKEGNRVSCAS